MQPRDSEFLEHCRTLPVKACVDHLTSCIENRDRLTKLNWEPEGPTELLSALQEVELRIETESFEHDPGGVERDRRLREAKKLRNLLEGPFVDFETFSKSSWAYRLVSFRGLFRSTADIERYNQKRFDSFEKYKLRIKERLIKLEAPVLRPNEKKMFNSRKDELSAKCKELNERILKWEKELRSPTKTKLPWVLIPPGSGSLQTIQSQSEGPERSETSFERIDEIVKLNPTRIYMGVNEFSKYYAFVFDYSRWVVFETDRPGNAVYAINGEWIQLSRLPKKKLLDLPRSKVRRVVHRGDWTSEVRRILQDGIAR